MKDEDQRPTEDELREAQALADALDGVPATGAPAGAGGEPPTDALETAALLRHARAPIAVPAAVEPIVAARVAPALDARRAHGRRRTRIWIATSLIAPAAAAVWLLASTITREPASSRSSLSPPAPTADLLGAQAQAARGGSQGSAALARLDTEMRAYRRRYHDALRTNLGDER